MTKKGKAKRYFTSLSHSLATWGSMLISTYCCYLPGVKSGIKLFNKVDVHW